MSRFRLASWLVMGVTVCAGVVAPAIYADVNEERTVDTFHSVVFKIPGTLVLVQTETPAIRLKGNDNDVARITTTVKGGVLYVQAKRKLWPSSSMGNVRVEVNFSELQAITVAGSGDAISKDIHADSLELAVHGSGDISLGHLTANRLQIRLAGSGDLSIDDATLDELTSDVSGSGDLLLSGRTETQTINVHGSGSVDYQELQSEAADVRIHGSGDVTLWADAQLDITIHGSGDVAYRGQAQLNERIHGSGSIYYTPDKSRSSL